MQKLFTLLAFTVLIITSCHKSNNDNNAITTQKLTGSYKVADVVVTNGTLTGDFYDSIDVCERDDLFEFNKDSLFDYADAGTVCSPDGSFQTTWSLTGNTLTVNGLFNATVKSLTTTTLVISYVIAGSSPAETVTETFTKQ